MVTGRARLDQTDQNPNRAAHPHYVIVRSARRGPKTVVTVLDHATFDELRPS